VGWRASSTDPFPTPWSATVPHRSARLSPRFRGGRCAQCVVASNGPRAVTVARYSNHLRPRMSVSSCGPVTSKVSHNGNSCTPARSNCCRSSASSPAVARWRCSYGRAVAAENFTVPDCANRRASWRCRLAAFAPTGDVVAGMAVRRRHRLACDGAVDLPLGRPSAQRGCRSASRADRFIPAGLRRPAMDRRL
jgi:hypothetical protein